MVPPTVQCLTTTVLWSVGPDTIIIYLAIHLRPQTTAERVHPGLAFETSGPLHGQGLEVYRSRRASPVEHLPIQGGVVHVVVRPVADLAL